MGSGLFSHDKLRQAVLAQLTAAERKEIHRRVANGIEQLYPDDAQYNPALLDHWQAAGDEEKELHYLLPVAKHLIEIAADDKRGYALVTHGLERLPAADARRVTLLNQQAGIYFRQARFDKATDIAEQALALAQTIDDDIGQAISLTRLGSIQFDQGQYRPAELYFQQSFDISKTAGDKKQMARSLADLGCIAEFQKNYDLAEDRFKQSLSLCQEIGDQQGVLNCFFYLGTIAAQYHSDYEASFAYRHKTLELSQKIGHQRAIARTYGSLGIGYGSIGNYPAAIENLEHNLSRKQTIGDPVGIGHAHLILGELYFFQGVAYDKVITYEEQAIEILSELKAYTILGIAHGYYILSHVKQGNYDQAVETILHHFELYSTIELDKSNGLVHIAMAKILFVHREDAVSVDHLSENIAKISKLTQLDATPLAYIKEAIQIATISQIRMEVLIGAGALAIDIGESGLARTYLTEAKDRAEQIGNSHKSSQIQPLLDQLSSSLGTINGRYLLHEEIGRGGMGVVYRATDPLTGNTVALKQIKADLSNTFGSSLKEDTPETARLAFAQEFQILAGLRHPHIVSVLDYGFDAKQEPYFTMDFLSEATTIQEAAQGLDTAAKIDLITQSLQALSYLHRRGVLHKDIKPSNILVSNGRVHLVDFGLSATDTQHSAVSGGTFLYMAPEIYHQTQAYSFSSDLYALGIVMYELLAGVHPFTVITSNSDREETNAHYPLEILNIQPDVATVLQMLLEKQPEQRYQSAHQALNALSQALGQTGQIESHEIRESYLQAATFVGRQTELKQLTYALEQSKAGNGAVWLLGGESGVGKSRLLEEVRTHALVNGWQVLRGQGVAEGGAPYQLWQDIVLRLALQTTLSDFEAGILKEIAPTLDRLLGRDITEAPKLQGKAHEHRLVLTLVELLKRQTQPTLLIVEDLQWVNESLGPIKQILKVLEQLIGVLVVGAYRHDERPDLPNMLPGSNMIQLERLSQAEVAQLSRAMLGEQVSHNKLVTLLDQETEGNTYFIVEVMRALAEEAGELAAVGQMALPEHILTSGMSTLLQRRLQKMPESDQPLLRLAAVAGRQIDERVLQVLTPETALVDWLQRGSEAAVLMVQENQWHFSHDKLRETLLAQLTTEQRQVSHRQVALAIEQSYPERAQYNDVLLAHWQAAGDEEKELEYLQLVAQNLVELVADYEKVRTLANRGLALLSAGDGRRVALLNYLATSYWRQGKYDDEGEKAAQQAHLLAQEVGDQTGIVDSLRNLGVRALLRGEYDDAHTYLQQGLTISREIGAQPRLASTLTNLGIIAGSQGDYEKARHYWLQSLAIWQEIGDQQGIAVVFNNLGRVALGQSNYAKALDYNQQSLAIKQMIGDQFGVINSCLNLGDFSVEHSEYETARDYWQNSLKIAQSIGSQQYTAETLRKLGGLAQKEGDYTTALNRLEQASAILQKIDTREGMVDTLNRLGYLATTQHQHDKAHQYLEQGLAIGEEIGSQKDLLATNIYLGILYFEQGQYQQATEKLEDALQQRLKTKAFQGIDEIYGYLPLSQIILGKRTAALQAIISYFELRQEIRAVTANGLVYLAAAQLLEGEAERQTSTVDLTPTIGQLTSLTQLEATPIAYFELALAQAKPYETRIRVLIEYGRHLLKHGQNDAAGTKLGEAKSMAEASKLKHKLNEIQAVRAGMGETATSLSPPQLIQVRETINGRYLLHEEIGRGGMGVVYRATDRLTGNIVALKQIKADLTGAFGSTTDENTPELIRLAFAQEFQILAGLRHPHIVSVLDYGFDANEAPYFTMDYLPHAMTIMDAAQSLDRQGKESLAIQATEALAYLHRRGIRHQDIKPSNILVNNGHVYIVDFGLSATEKHHSTLSGGTMLYMAPEVYNQTEVYSFASDLYSLGIVIYQLFAGVHPFNLITQESNESPIDAPFDFSLLDLQQPLLTVLQKLLQKQPKQRYSQAYETLISLKTALGKIEQSEHPEIRESFLQAATFVGRKTEMDQLTNALTASKKGNGSAWLVGGESGVGKSRLLLEVQTEALVQGFHLLRGHGLQDNSGLPYQLWREPVRQLLITAQEIDDLTASVLLPLVPDIETLLGRTVKPAPVLKGEEQTQIRLFTTVARLFWQAERPLLLILEDLHWATESLLIIPYLTRLVADYRLLIIGNYRNEEQPDLPAKLSGMQLITLSPLTKLEMAELSVAMLGQAGNDPAIVEFIQRETEGNTFFAVEVVRALAEEAGQLGHIGQMALPTTLLPNGIRDIVQRRIAKLPTWGQNLLLKAAVTGLELEIKLIQQLSDGPHAEDEWLLLCADAAVLDVQNGVWQFSHGKIRETLLTELGLDPNKKVALHREVALAIERLHPDNNSQAARLVNHWHEAKDATKEHFYTNIAGHQAATRFAYQDALRYFKRTIALTPATDPEQRYALHLACLTAHKFLGEKVEYLQTLDTLANLADSLNDDLKRLDVMYQRGAFLAGTGQQDKAEELFSQVVTLAQNKDQTAIKAKALADWVFSLAVRRKLPEAQSKLAQYQQLVEQSDSNIDRGEVFHMQGSIVHYSGDMHQAKVYHQSYLHYAQEETGDLNAVSIALSNLALIHNNLGEFEQAQSNNEQALQLTRKMGNIPSEAMLQNNIGMHQIRLGEYESATVKLTASLTLSRQIGDRLSYSYALNNIGVAYYKNGDYEQAEQYLQQAIVEKQALNDPWSEAYTWNYLGHLFLTQNRANEALVAYKTAESLQIEVSETTILIETYSGLAATFTQLNKLAEAQTYASKVWTHLQAKGIDAGWAWGISLLHLHEVFAKLDDQRATAVIELAHTELQKRASHIATEANRQKYLTQVPENREIARLYEALPDQIAAETIINGRYLLHEEIGRGGMGAVHRATDRLSGNIVALKQIKTNPRDTFGSSVKEGTPELIRLAFAQEFQILAGLRHPHIVSVLDYGFTNKNEPYFAMNYLANAETLLMYGQRCNPEEKINLIIQVLQALAYLHRRGIQHRDLKPSNILVNDHTVYLVDFGLSATQKHTAIVSGGTIKYMAPEIYTESSPYETTADLYSVGIIIYELLGDLHPFETITEETGEDLIHIEYDFERLNLSAPFTAVLKKLLQKKPARRYQSVSATLQDLHHALERPQPEETQEIRDSYLQTASFIGRRAERERLEAALAEAGSGTSSVWLLGGESGVGKTRLIDEFRIQALVKGWQVIRGQVVEEGGRDYHLWHEIIPYLVLNDDLTDLEAGILRAISPQIGQLLGREIPRPPQLTGTAEQERLALTLVTVLKRQPKPTLLLLEDLHWAHESLNPIKQILNNLEQIPNLMVVGTYRHDERPDLPQSLAGAQTLILERLQASQIENLAKAMLGEAATTPEIISLLTQETEGNTFFIVEVMRALAEEAGQLDKVRQMVLPDEVLTGRMQQLLMRRIYKMPEADQPLLQLAAVAGRQLDIKLLQTFQPDVSDWLQKALEYTIIILRDGQWLFAHDKLRKAILSNLADETRQDLHAKIAEAIESVYPKDSAYYQSLLEHWHQNRHLEKELHYLTPVARHLIYDTNDYTHARSLLKRGLNQIGNSDQRAIKLFNLLARAHISQSEFELAQQYAEQAQSLAQQHNNVEELAASHNNLGIIAHEQANYKDAQTHHQQALALWETLDHKSGMLDSIQGLMAEAFRSGRYQQTYELAQKGLALSQEIGNQAREARMLTNLGLANDLMGNVAPARTYYKQALAQNREIGHQENLIIILINFGNLELQDENYEQAIIYLKEGLTISRTIGKMVEAGINLDNLGAASILQGRYSEANYYLEESLKIAQQTGDRLGVVSCHTMLAFMHLKDEEAGDLNKAKSYLYEALVEADSIQTIPETLKILIGFATLYLIKGEQSAWARQLIELAQSHPASYMEVNMWLKQFEPLLPEAVEPAVSESITANGTSLDLNQAVQEILGQRYPVEAQQTINGRYLLHEEIGRGGMGTVHRATDRLSGETIALKQITTGLQNPLASTLASETPESRRLALAQEFQILASLRHPHIISVLNYGFDNEQNPFFTMDYLRNAQTILEAGQHQPLGHKIELIKQLLLALTYLHRQGVLHKDIKPSNILVNDGHLRVLDFGLSVMQQQGSTFSGGTARYTAPELFENIGLHNASTDLYAVGIIFYELLVGQHPYDNEESHNITATLSQLGVNTAINQIVTTLLAEEPGKRYTSAKACLLDIAKLDGQEKTAESKTIRESFLQAATFVGREAELTQLQNSLAEAKKGESSVWLLGGESGVGKSRLIEEFRTHALVSGWHVLNGQAIVEEGAPYQLWRTIVPSLIINSDLSDLEAGILKPIVSDIDRLLGRVVPAAPEAEGVEAERRLILTLMSLLRQQTQPTLLILEDLQWAHRSLEPLKQLLNIIEQLSHIMVLGSYRNDETPNLHEDLNGAHNLILDRLNVTQIAALSRAMLGDQGATPQIISLLSQETEGNTFFIVEVMRALAEEAGQLDDVGEMVLPTAVLTNGMHHLLMRRIEKIDTADQQLLQVAAVTGRQLDIPLLTHLAPTQNIEAWLHRLTEASILSIRDGVWLFAHDKLREAILEGLIPDARRAIHRKLAEAIELIYPSNSTYEKALLEHWHSAGDVDKAIEYLSPVARDLVDITADYKTALRLLERGLNTLSEEDPRRIHLWNLQAKGISYLSDYDRAIQITQQTQALATKLQDKKELAESLSLMANALSVLSEHEQAKQAVQESLALNREINNQRGIARNLSTLANLVSEFREYEEATDYLNKSLAINQEIGDIGGIANNLHSLAGMALDHGDFDKALGYLQKSLSFNQELGDQRGIASSYMTMGICARNQRKYGQALEQFQQAHQVFQTTGNKTGLSTSLNNMARVAYLQGNYQQAITYAEETHRIREAIGYKYGQVFSLLILGFSHLKLKHSEATQIFWDALSLARDIQSADLMEAACSGFTWLYQEKGELERAAELIGLIKWNDAELWLEGLQNQLEASLGPAALQTALERGKSLNLDQVATSILDEFSAEKETQEKSQLKIDDSSREATKSDTFDSPTTEASPSPIEQTLNPNQAQSEPSMAQRIAQQTESILETIIPDDKASSEEKLRGEALLTHLLAISRKMAEMRSLAPLLSYAIDEVLPLIGAERGYIVLIEADGALDYRVKQRADGSIITSNIDPISHSILDEVVKSQKAIVVRNALLDPRFGSAHSVVAMRLRSIMCAPLITKNQIIGAIYVENRSKAGRFTEGDLAPLEFFSNQAAVAIENANINENLEQLVDERTKELAEAKDVAEAANEAKTNFLSNMSHELRTPLNAILNFSGFVYDGIYGDTNEDQQLALQRVMDSGEHLLSLINDVLDINKIEAGMMNLVFEEIDVNKLLQHTISTARGLIKDKDLQLITDQPNNLPVIQADRRRVRQIFLNIIANAVKYTPSGYIIIDAEEHPDYVQVSVKDTGIGIAPEDYQSVFQSFLQARHNLENVLSTGLGLPITKQLVELHHGKMWFESILGQGSTFYIQLPKRQA